MTAPPPGFRKTTAPPPGFRKVVEPSYEDNWYDRPRAVLQGMTLGFSDEVGAGIAALATQITGESGGKSFTEVYRDIAQSLQNERKAYEKANPGEALALNVVGGLATGKASLQNIQKLSKLGPAGKAVLMATEGAIAGAGSADIGATGEGAASGAALSTAIAAIPVVGRGLANQYSKRRVAQELGKGGDFIPYNMAADDKSTLGSIYKDLVGRAYGGGELVEQSERVLKKAGAKRDLIGGSLDIAKQTEKRQADEVISSAKRAAEDAIDTAKANKEITTAQAKTALVKTTNKLNQDFRDKALLQSLPDNVSQEVMEQLKNATPQERNAILGPIWTSQGFKIVKERDFMVDEDALVKSIMDSIDDPALTDQAGKVKGILNRKIGSKLKRQQEPAGFTSDIVPKQKFKSTSQGMIQGDDLIEARNSYRRRINELGDTGEAALEKKALREAAEKIDDIIRNQLDDESRVLFDKERGAWGAFQTMRDATDKASVTKQGLFDADDWLRASKYGTGRSRGQAILQQDAQGVQKSIDAAKDVALDAQTTATKNTTAATKAARTARDSTVDAAREDLSQGPLSSPLAKTLEEANTSYNVLKSRVPKTTPSNIERIATTSLLGAPVTPLVPGSGLMPAALGLVPLGAGVAKTMSKPGTQRFLAGQGDTQKYLAELLRQYDASTAKNTLSATGRGLRRGLVVGSDTGEQY